MFYCHDDRDRAAGSAPDHSGIRLQELIPHATYLKSDNLVVKSCCGKWDECRPDDLFVALVTAEQDGHEDAHLAVQRGAAAVLGERMLPVAQPQCLVPDSRIAYGTICHALAGTPSDHLSTIGVSGTDGKTTVVHLIQSILDEAGLTVALSSSLDPMLSRPAIGQRPFDEMLAGPPRLASWLSHAAMQGNRFALWESSSLALAQHQMAGIELDVAVLTNIRGRRFDFHGSLNNYRNAQLRLLEYLKPNGFAVLNADDPASYFALNEIEQPAMTVGIRQAAEIEATPLETTLDGQTFLITAGRDSVTIRSRMIGRHHIYNCLAAAAVAITHDIDLATIARGLERIEQLPGRMNLVCCGQPFVVAVDQAATPYRLSAALRTLRGLCPGRLICVFSAGPNDTHETCGQFGRVVERTSFLPVITLNRSGKHLDYEPAHRILDGFEKPKRAQLIPQRIDAVQWALGQAQPGDAVLIAGGGEQPIAAIGNDRWQITDRDVCESWLYDQPVFQPSTTKNRENIFRIDDYR